ncbi:glutathione S-transferase family protein [Shewanella pneumatophori]|uniref:Glutathione S-transferase N-terminal domain-containing protein n=1 Tax=Shewanella pneumatophori TaxID=314092 RepID=A0A9X1ZJ26_9GAMM|nr:glutathione S-transferase N-terminal domain-containing protein [Shewanella pneumatophori]MCL1138703.1 glutathione S-transferase N-terminal domain-containing protein [Shewanella pneumatophori]
MKLFYSDASPYARCVRVLLRYYGVNDVAEVIVDPFVNDAEFLRCNPLAKVPCLSLNDGSSLYDSEVIMKFIDAKYGDSKLFAGQYNDWANQCHFSLLKGMLDSAVSLRQEQLREQDGLRSDFWAARFEQALLRGLKQVEQLGLSHFQELTAQQVMLVCLLDYLDFRHPQLSWRKVVPALSLWHGNIAQTELFLSTLPKR